MVFVWLNVSVCVLSFIVHKGCVWVVYEVCYIQLIGVFKLKIYTFKIYLLNNFIDR